MAASTSVGICNQAINSETYSHHSLLLRACRSFPNYNLEAHLKMQRLRSVSRSAEACDWQMPVELLFHFLQPLQHQDWLADCLCPVISALLAKSILKDHAFILKGFPPAKNKAHPEQKKLKTRTAGESYLTTTTTPPKKHLGQAPEYCLSIQISICWEDQRVFSGPLTWHKAEA